MKINFCKHASLMSLTALIFSISLSAQKGKLPVAEGPYKPTEESLAQFKCPEWFRDAKFGIWSHWGPQAVPRQGDWYAKRMYQEGNSAYKYHLEHYGHPSVFGYKDIIPLWKAEKWDPDKLMELYKKVGAKYFVSMGTHHDNFFLWDSKIHDWNSVNMGPKKDVVGLWQKAAQKQGLKFGVSEHLGASFTWFQTAHLSDKQGPKAGVPYDGANPEYQDLYHPSTTPDDKEWLTNNLVFQIEWFRSIRELIDNYHPDLIYSDSRMPFEDVGRSLLAHFFNQDIAGNSGILNAVYTCKQASYGKWVQDVERGSLDSICPFPWQTDTSIGDWYYRTGQKYMTGTEVIQMLVDIVSKNGNLLLNVVQTPEGDLEPDVLAILDEIAGWIPANGEGIYETRPWKVYGEGPSMKNQAKGTFGGVRDVRSYTPADIRFTVKGETLYAFCMQKPTGDITLTSLGKNSKLTSGQISSIKILGSDTKVKWSQNSNALIIRKPSKLPSWNVVCLKIEFKK